MMSSRIPMVVDTDVGTDDAVALVLALRDPRAEVVVVTAVAGNTSLPNVVQNALYTAEITGVPVSVHPGAPRPLLRELATAAEIHGGDGLGDIGLPLRDRIPSGEPAVEALLRAAREHRGELVLVTLAPLTNVALACLADPDFAASVRRCVMMGGTGQGPGNVTPVAEFNIWVDPEAAAIVFRSGLDITMVGWDACQADATFSEEELESLWELGTPLARFCVGIQQVSRRRAISEGRTAGICIPDPLAMAVALEPTIITESRRLAVAVETRGDLTRGQTVVDHARATGLAPNCEVVFRADRGRFMEMVRGALL